MNAGIDVSRRFEYAVGRGDAEDLALFDVHRARGIRVNLGPGMPGDPGDGIGKLEQPGTIRATPVAVD